VFLVVVEEVSLSVLSMNSESFLPRRVMSWLMEQFVDFSSSLSWCLMVDQHFFRMCQLYVLGCILAISVAMGAFPS